jgi:hypothetical protein
MHDEAFGVGHVFRKGYGHTYFAVYIWTQSLHLLFWAQAQ